MTQEELVAEMEKLAVAGDVKAFEAFALEHFKEMPEGAQGKVLFGFFQEALEKKAGEAAIAQIQKEGIEALNELDELKRSVSEEK